ncbi:hypothetical protein G4X40_10005 [Rhodococcus sp. D2-41]|nr:hypothetical protein [Rhodococcus sp. D2-41]
MLSICATAGILTVFGAAVATSADAVTSHVDPNGRDYTCTLDTCTYPDGSYVPGYVQCGVACGAPPTSGDIQSCISVQGNTPQQCDAILRQQEIANGGSN